jgi:hypothetical protein
MSATSSDANLPLFYRQPRILDSVQDSGLKLKQVRRFGFAAETNSIPLAADEFYVAQAYYPIVFTANDPAQPVAVVGVANRRNLFVGADGAWRAGSYIPAYVRRYPFIFAKPEGREEFILAIDEAADAFSKDEGEPLFADGKPTEIANHALQFCLALQRQQEAAMQFAAALGEHKLLVENRAELRAGQSSSSLTGFRIIDEVRFNSLPDEVFLEWRKRGWLGLAYAQLMSMRRWDVLAELSNAAGANG